MTQEEYNQTKHDCWKQFCREHGIITNDPSLIGAFGYAFDGAYALGREKETITQEEIENEAVDCAFGENKKRPDARPDTMPEYTCEDLINAFKAGANFALGKQENGAKKSKKMCLRNRTKVCNQCHECDIDISNPYHNNIILP